jgi:hypothetical protein
MPRVLLPFVNARVTAFHTAGGSSRWAGTEDAVLYERDVIDVGQDLSEAKHTILFTNDVGLEPDEGDKVTYTPVDDDTGAEGSPVTRTVRDSIRYRQLHLLRTEAWDE